MLTYDELVLLSTFEERYEYLNLKGSVGIETFGSSRFINQSFYQSPEWMRIRDRVIIRDNGCDLGISDRNITGRIIIHHMNPITLQDLLDRSPLVYDSKYLVCVSYQTHLAIHYGNSNLLLKDPIDRKPNDTCPWKRGDAFE